MPTTRTRRRRTFQPAVSRMQWALLTDQPFEFDSGLGENFERWCFQWCTDDFPPWGQRTGRALWREHGEAVLSEWVVETPGTRPSTWWRVDAPDPRQRVGGIGTPLHECTAYVMELVCGVPLRWLTPALAKRGFLRPIVEYPAIDPANPPVFESQATYLDRYNLLLPGERRRLRDADFRPEPITEIVDIRSQW